MTLRSLLAYPLLRVKMMRVGHGFTVHSPFAYHFITCVLRERLPYYCFRDEVLTKADRRLFRVAVYFRPRTVAIIGDAPRAREILHLACPHACECADPAAADLTYLAGSRPIPPAFNILYAETPRPLPSAAMTFTNGRTLIAVRRPALPPQSFRLRF